MPRHAAAKTYVRSGLFDGLTEFVQLETRIRSLPSEKGRGDAFEVFAEAFFATQRIAQSTKI